MELLPRVMLLCVEKREFSLTGKILREINSEVTSLVKLQCFHEIV